jgi:HSP20 family protein
MTLVKVNNPISKAFDGLMTDFFNDFPAAVSKTLREDFTGFAPVNIKEDPAGYSIQLAAPGFDKADFGIKLENNVLTLSAEHKEEVKTEGEKVVRTEFSRKSFKRSFTIDEKIDVQHIAAKYDNGILHVHLPKKEEVKAVAKEIVIA